MNYFIGIDNSSLDHKVRVIDQNGKLKSSFTVENSLNGFEGLKKKLEGISDIKIGFELPHGPLVDFLHEKGYHIYSLNPLKIKRYKESIKVSGNKNDDIDDLAIAEYLQANSTNINELNYNSSEIERSKNFSIIHSRLTQDRARHLNKLHFAVRQYFPLQDTLFTEFGCTVQLDLIRKYPTFSNLRAAFAFASLQYSTLARTYYDNQRLKGKTHSVAVRALSNKWVKVIYKIWKDEIFFEESKLFLSAA